MIENKEKKEKKNTKEERRKFLTRMIQEFERFYKSEKDCQEKINNMLYPDGNYVCRECNSHRVEKEYGDRNIKCLKCKKVTSLTTDTFFHKIQSARSYLAPIWMMERGIILNASEIGRISNVVNSTGQLILKKIAYVVKNEMKEEIPYVASEQMIHTICKRSKETRRRQHPQSEISDAKAEKIACVPELTNGNELLNNNQKIIDCDKRVDRQGVNLVLDKIEEAILNALSGIPVQLEVLQEKTNLSTSNLLPALTMLELNGVIDRLPGELFKKKRISNEGFAQPFREWGAKNERHAGEIESRSGEVCSNLELQENENDHIVRKNTGSLIPKFKLEKTIRLIKERFHGISRKYLQYYLAVVWVSVDRGIWIADALLEACCRAPDIKAISLFSYVSPYDVRIVIVE